ARDRGVYGLLSGEPLRLTFGDSLLERRDTRVFLRLLPLARGLLGPPRARFRASRPAIRGSSFGSSGLPGVSSAAAAGSFGVETRIRVGAGRGSASAASGFFPCSRRSRSTNVSFEAS